MNIKNEIWFSLSSNCYGVHVTCKGFGTRSKVIGLISFVFLFAFIKHMKSMMV